MSRLAWGNMTSIVELREAEPNLYKKSAYPYPIPEITARDGFSFACEGYCSDVVLVIGKK